MNTVAYWNWFTTEKVLIVKLKHSLQSCDKNGKHIDG